jgi:predicted dehydrogenase
MTPVSLGLIGVGRHGSRYFHHLLTEDTGGTLLGFSRNHQEKGQNLALEHQLRFYPDWHDLLADTDIQAVVVVTPPTLNLPIAQEAFQVGKAVLVEKPLALDSRRASQIVDAGRRSGRPLMVAHTLRYEPTIQRLKTLEKSLGPWHTLRATMMLPWPSGSPRKKEGWERFGVLMDVGIHLLDVIRFLTQDEVSSVSAVMDYRSVQEPESQVEVQLTTRGGISCSLKIARLVQDSRQTHLELTGAQGQAIADWTNGMVRVTTPGHGSTDHPCPKQPTIVHLLRDFLRTIRSGGTMPIPGEEGLQAVTIAEACYQSADLGHPISIPP